MQWLKEYKWLILITVLAFIVRLVLIYFNPKYTFQEDVGLEKLAYNLVVGNGYGYEMYGKFALYWGYPPGAAGLYASMLLLFSDAYIPTRILQAFIDSFGCILIYLASKELFNKQVGIISAFIYAIFLSIAFMSTWIAHDALLPFFTLSIFYCFILAIKRSKWYYFVITGIVTGISCYFQPTTLFLPVVLGIGYYIYRLDKTSLILIVKNILLVLVSMTIVIMPWIVRNYNVAGVITPMRSAGWVTIYCGFNEFGNSPEKITLNDLEQLRLDNEKYGLDMTWASKEYEEFYRDKVIQFVKDHPVFVVKNMIKRIPWAVIYKPEMGLSNYEATYEIEGTPDKEYYMEYPQLLHILDIVASGKVIDYVKQYPRGAIVTFITLLYILLPIVLSIIATAIYRRRELLLIWAIPVYYSVISIAIITINAKNKVPGLVGYIMLSSLAIYYIYCKIRNISNESKTYDCNLGR